MTVRLLLLTLAVLAEPAAARHADKPVPKPLLSSVDGLPIGEIPRQQLPASGCAAYLWSGGATHALVAMASADPAQLRLAIDGKLADYPRTAQQGLGGFGFDQTTIYAAGDVTATLDMAVQAQASLTQGATVPSGALTIARAGRDTIVLPVGGLIGCAPTPQGGTQ